MKAIQTNHISVSDLDRHLRALRGKNAETRPEAQGEDSDFSKLLKDGIREINSTIKDSEKASVDLAAGKPVNLHETMLSVTKAELAFNLAVQMRNKTVEAYQEIMRMQV
jgi:flagellar hook-basal body complex protein FliE